MKEKVHKSEEEKKATSAAVASLKATPTDDSTTPNDGLINASGHREQLDRNFGIVSIIGYAITAGNAWIALGGTIVRTAPSFTAFVPLTHD